MNLFEKLVEKALETSPRLIKLSEDVKEDADKMLDYLNRNVKQLSDVYDIVSKVSERVSSLTTAVVNITQTIQLHQKAITDLYTMQNTINSALNSKRPAIDLPEINKSKDEKPN